MRINEKQFEFSKALAKLVLYMYSCGYTVSFGDVKASTGHKDKSKHYIALAADLNLFKHGEYLTETEDHKPFGMYWISIGGSWGGNFSEPDGNHYEWPL